MDENVRAAFEAWLPFGKTGRWVETDTHIHAVYMESDVQLVWIGWQAAAAHYHKAGMARALKIVDDLTEDANDAYKECADAIRKEMEKA